MPVIIQHHNGRKKPLFSAEPIHRIAQIILNKLGYSDYGVNIVLTNDAYIHQLNKKYRNKDSATNVLSFPFAADEDPQFSHLPTNELGDIIISEERAVAEAIQYDISPQKRMTWLVIHGLLHLLGYDHELSSANAEKMFAKEKEILDYLKTKRTPKMTQLAINVDHVATIRQVRGGKEPDPVTAAAVCELAGACGIVVHLREDRRHIQDKDVYLLRQMVKTKLNLEMGANKEIIDIALDVSPDMITLVPEKRQELTTEGGLDVISQKKKLAKVLKRFNKAGIPVSIFIDPDLEQIRASHDIGATFVEIHTGRYCDALNEKQQDEEFALISDAVVEASALGLRVNGGHGLDYTNTAKIAALDSIEELSIGHAIISRSVFTGLERAVRDMLDIIAKADNTMF